ncbi:Uncharacterised protein [Acinetobacter baumannii]|nr:Uncharacterised protein [Acinetobacter baumannii]
MQDQLFAHAYLPDLGKYHLHQPAKFQSARRVAVNPTRQTLDLQDEFARLLSGLELTGY